jgi:hypothetical protein
MAIVTAKHALQACVQASAQSGLPVHVNLFPAGPGQPAPPAPPTGPVISSFNLDHQEEVSRHTGTRILAALIAIAVVILALWLTYINVDDPTFKQGATPSAPVQGLTIFAVFFVAAAAIERLLEPLSKMLPSATEKKAEADSGVAGAGQALITQELGQAATPASDASTVLSKAATTVDDANYRAFWKSLLLWTIAIILALIASAFLRLYFLRTVGISNGPRVVEILATGLIIGSGTKPLHDLITLISKASD